jgi:hypothetical protein
MTDPQQLAEALAFLGGHPEASITLSPATPERRRFLLEDIGGALSLFTDLPNARTAQAAAAQVFELAADVWREYLTGEAAADRAALNLHAWARMQASSSLRTVPAPLITALPESFPQVAAWVSTVHGSGVLTLAEAGTAVAWWAVCILAAMIAGPGFEDGQPEDLLTAVLSSLEVSAGRVLN